MTTRNSNPRPPKKAGTKKRAPPKKKAAARRPAAKKAAPAKPHHSAKKAATKGSRKSKSTTPLRPGSVRAGTGKQENLFGPDLAPLPDIGDERLLVPLNVAALAFGISVESLKKWGVPSRMKVGRETLYYLPDLIQYRVKRADANENNLADARAELARSQKRKTDLEVAQLEGDLIPAAVILENWTPLVGAARQKVLAIPTKIKTQIPKLTQRDLKKITTICRSCLEDLANGGLPKSARRAGRPAL